MSKLGIFGFCLFGLHSSMLCSILFLSILFLISSHGSFFFSFLFHVATSFPSFRFSVPFFLSFTFSAFCRSLLLSTLTVPLFTSNLLIHESFFLSISFIICQNASSYFIAVVGSICCKIYILSISPGIAWGCIGNIPLRILRLWHASTIQL